VRHLQSLGAVCVAKSQLNAFAYGLSGENNDYGDCPHPHLTGALSGGSSSGSAHLVGSGRLPLAIGTDTGGSIRLPAAWCGLYGLRLTPDACLPDPAASPLSEGLFPLAPDFDTVGWFTPCAATMAAMIGAWFGVDRSDRPARNQLIGAALPPPAAMSPEAKKAYETSIRSMMDSAELSLDPSALPAHFQESAAAAFNVLQSCQAKAAHAERIETLREHYDPRVLARILRADTWTEPDKTRARHFRSELLRHFDQLFDQYDYLLMPACPAPAPPGRSAAEGLREATLQLTAPASLGGLPVLSIPVFIDAKRSIGLQAVFPKVDPLVWLQYLQSLPRLSGASDFQ
jgi:amidase/aspartyl-tRNA(Asn)/glutamyl-tRNA(Gln) amidotransferase subunit A